MNNIQQFLEQRGEIELDDGSYLDLQQHNAILINFILGEVEREVAKLTVTKMVDEQTGCIDTRIATKKDISTIITNLRVK